MAARAPVSGEGDCAAAWAVVAAGPRRGAAAPVQFFNIAILSLASLSRALSGLLTRQIASDALIALPAPIGGAWSGGYIYRRLADRGYQRVVMVLLLASGLGLIWAT
jgi:uncharacterized membrane protein YfcA